MNPFGHLKSRFALPITALLVGIAIGMSAMCALNTKHHHSVEAAQLLRADLTGMPDKEVLMSVIEVQPGAGIAPHLHHGDEFVYVIEGSYERFIGQTRFVANEGTGFSVERERIHGGKAAGTSPTKLLTVHVLDKGRPFAEAAQ